MENKDINIPAEEALKLFQKAEHNQGSYNKDLGFECYVTNYKNISYDRDYDAFMREAHSDIKDGTFTGINLKLHILEKESLEPVFEKEYSSNDSECLLEILPEHLQNLIKENPLNKIMETYKETLPKIRFAIEEIVYYGGASIKETANNFEEIKEIYDNKYNISGDSYTSHDIVLIDRNDKKIDKQLNEQLLKIMNDNLIEDKAVLIDSKSNKKEFAPTNDEHNIFYKVYLYREEDFEPKFNVGVDREDMFKQFNTKDQAVTDFYLTTYQKVKDQTQENENKNNKRSRER